MGERKQKRKKRGICLSRAENLFKIRLLYFYLQKIESASPDSTLTFYVLLLVIVEMGRVYLWMRKKNEEKKKTTSCILHARSRQNLFMYTCSFSFIIIIFSLCTHIKMVSSKFILKQRNLTFLCEKANDMKRSRCIYKNVRQVRVKQKDVTCIHLEKVTIKIKKTLYSKLMIE